jgi:hypothetical protein
MSTRGFFANNKRMNALHERWQHLRFERLRAKRKGQKLGYFDKQLEANYRERKKLVKQICHTSK